MADRNTRSVRDASHRNEILKNDLQKRIRRVSEFSSVVKAQGKQDPSRKKNKRIWLHGGKFIWTLRLFVNMVNCAWMRLTRATVVFEAIILLISCRRACGVAKRSFCCQSYLIKQPHKTNTENTFNMHSIVQDWNTKVWRKFRKESPYIRIASSKGCQVWKPHNWDGLCFTVFLYLTSRKWNFLHCRTCDFVAHTSHDAFCSSEASCFWWYTFAPLSNDDYHKSWDKRSQLPNLINCKFCIGWNRILQRGLIRFSSVLCWKQTCADILYKIIEAMSSFMFMHSRLSLLNCFDAVHPKFENSNKQRKLDCVIYFFEPCLRQHGFPGNK